jgi:SpoVK/Ycf46/Vps4 family AAA+-type ATPase
MDKVITGFLHDNGEEENTQRNLCQWSVLEDGRFAPAYTTTKIIPEGLYEIIWDSPLQNIILKKQETKTDELFELPSPEIQSILDDIKIFFDKKETYKKYNFVHKRGILLYGQPGCGKSGIIQLCTKNLIEKNKGIVINIKGEDDFNYFIDFISTIRSIEKDRPIIVIMEDIDSLVANDRNATSKLLNILDGVKQVDNIVYIATTNYPEKLEERISNRPSRFDRRYKIEMPDEKIRESFIVNKLDKKELKTINLEEWVEKTEGMSLSHLKEILISVIVMGKDFDEVMESLNSMNSSPVVKMSKKVGFGTT